MADYIIATASTADLPRAWLDAHRIPFISYSYIVNDNELREDDCREESRAAVFAGMRAGDLLKTSMINEFVYYDFFKDLMERGQDVIFLDMSQKMSASYQNCLEAGEMIRKEYPTRRFYIMDTRCISGGLGVLVKAMVSRMEQGMGYDELIAWGEENKLKVIHRFTVNDLKYLKAGGRVSNASALVGAMLQIKPVIYVPDAGTLDVLKKVRGRSAAINEIREGVLRDVANMDAADVHITLLHADCLADAELLREQLLAQRPGIAEIDITTLGVVIGAHCGPGFLAAVYLNKNGRTDL
ncbi:MAG: DegV family protein [Oscillospiraceae bacterium]|nr:DegV family protein [Oscillospiraceae bacterium]